jgi:DNA-binding NtrC family response regulator
MDSSGLLEEMDPPNWPDSHNVDWPFEVALVPSTARSILITGGEPRHWQMAARALHHSGTFVSVAFAESDDAAFERALQECSGGVLLLQDIDKATATQQGLLFRFLSARQVGQQPVRVVAASTQRVFDLVTAAAFDEPLFYRLNTWHIVLKEG